MGAVSVSTTGNYLRKPVMTKAHFCLIAEVVQLLTKRSLGSLFTDSTIRSIIQQSLNMKSSKNTTCRETELRFSTYFLAIFILFLFYLFNMKMKYDVRIYLLTSQEYINNTSAEENRQLRSSPPPKS